MASRAPWALVVAGSAGCGGVQSALDPAGIQASRVEGLWWFMLIIAAAVFLLVVAAMLYSAMSRRPRGYPTAEEVRRERRMTVGIIAATVATVVILFVFLIVNFATERALASLPGDEAVSVKVTGYQWWWEIEYIDSIASRRVITANELHVPVGAPIRIELESRDVIHSFWIPRLHGKLDMVPGYTNVLWLRADSAGVYRGQCAEFCGHQHAKMAITVVAESRAQFDAWMSLQRQPAPEPVTPQQARGRDVFLEATCLMCHTVRGTPAGGSTGPDLTHLATRGTLAAGTLPNTRGNLAGWILDPQSIKPGVKMPANSLSPADLNALLSYLETLK
jgi:cytochrome c oxidase subunit 2